MVEDEIIADEIIEDDCECEDIPLITFCKKCKRFFLIGNEFRWEISKSDN